MKKKRRQRLFEYIYKYTWLLLSTKAEELILVLGHHMNATGTSFEQIKTISPISEDHLSDALEELKQYNLVTVGGSISHKVFSMHRFTQVFVQVQFPIS